MCEQDSMAEFEIREEQQTDGDVLLGSSTAPQCNYEEEEGGEEGHNSINFVLASMGMVVASASSSPSSSVGHYYSPPSIHGVYKDHRAEQDDARNCKKLSSAAFASIFIGIIVVIPMLYCFVLFSRWYSHGASGRRGGGTYDNDDGNQHLLLLVNVSGAAAAMQLLADDDATAMLMPPVATGGHASAYSSVAQKVMMIASWKSFDTWGKPRKASGAAGADDSSAVQLHVTYIMDAYLTTTQKNGGRRCRNVDGDNAQISYHYYCRGGRRRRWCKKRTTAVKKDAMPSSPLLLLLDNDDGGGGDDHGNSRLDRRSRRSSLHIIASVADPLWLPWMNPLAKFVGSQSSEDGQDWNMLEFRDALVQTCRAVDAEQQKLAQTRFVTTVEDLMVPSRICSMVAAPRTGATLRGLARLAGLMEDSKEGVLPLREYSGHLFSRLQAAASQKSGRGEEQAEVPQLYVLDETSDGSSVLPMFARDEGLLPALYWQQQQEWSSSSGEQQKNEKKKTRGVGIIVMLNSNSHHPRLLSMLMDLCSRAGLPCTSCPAGVCVSSVGGDGGGNVESQVKQSCTCIFAREDAKVF